jgi:hypothetical protein
MPEMDRLLAEGSAASPYQAGLEVSGKAAGSGSVVTKAKRLASPSYSAHGRDSLADVA